MHLTLDALRRAPHTVNSRLPVPIDLIKMLVNMYSSPCDAVMQLIMLFMFYAALRLSDVVPTPQDRINRRAPLRSHVTVHSGYLLFNHLYTKQNKDPKRYHIRRI